MIRIPVSDYPIAVIRCDARGRFLGTSRLAEELCARMPELIGSIAALVAGRPGKHGRAEFGTGSRRLTLQVMWESEQFSDRSCVVFILADQRQEERDPTLALTRRERETARLAATGLRTREIALQLGCSERTVRAHLQASYGKLGLRSRAELAARLAGVG